MKQRSWLPKMLNIRREEYKPVVMLMVFSFFIGMSISFYFTASNAIFLKHFKPQMIPVSFIASGIIIYLAWWMFSHIDKKLSLYYQVVIKFLFVFISVVAISFGVYAFNSGWVTFIMYTWVRLIVYITLVNFWGVAGRLFNVRQGKRIFALISIGEVVSYMTGYLSIPLILKFLNTSNLLFLASFFLFICLVMVLIIFATFKDQLQTGIVSSVKVAKSSQSEWNYWNLLKKPYFRIISLMALLPIFGYLFVDFLFLAQTKVEFANDPKEIARFLAIFLGSLAFFEILLKLVSGRFLNKYGLRPSLLSLPAILVFSIILAAGFGALYGPIGMFFSFIALARLFERSIRGAVYEPAFQLLYQPVPTDQRLTFQNQIEGIPKAFGTVITGVVILLLSSIPAFNLVHFSWAFIIVLGFWIWIAYKMYEEYRNMLKTKLSELKSSEPEGQDAIKNLYSQILTDANPAQFQQVYEIMETAEPGIVAKTLEGIFPLANPSIQKAVLSIIKEKQLVNSLPFLLRVKDQQQSPGNELLIDETISTLKTAEDYPFEYMMGLSRSDDARERLRAARLLGASGRYNTYKLLINLLKDPDPDIVKAAILSCGMVKRYELWPFIIENLIVPEFSNTAATAVIKIGEPILADVDRLFEKISGHKTAQIKIIRIYETIGGAKSLKLLRDKITFPDKDIRFRVLLALSNLEYHASISEIPFIKGAIEESAENIVWLLASLHDISGTVHDNELQLALMQEMEEKKEHVFLLLSLLYDSKTIRHIRENIESKDTNAKIYALEIGDMMIATELKELFFPIFEDLSVLERLNRFLPRFPQEKLTLRERLYDIINKGYSHVSRWTKACALHVLINEKPDDLETTSGLLAANMVNPDPIMRELAAWGLHQLNREYYFDTLVRFKKNEMEKISGIAGKIKSSQQGPQLLFHKALMLKNTELFSTIQDNDIANLLINLDGPAQPKSAEAALPAKYRHDPITVTSDDGFTIKVPHERLFEIMTGDPALAGRYFRIFCKIVPK